MNRLKLVFVLRKHILYLFFRDKTVEFDLNNYAFDAMSGIRSGKYGNHLFKANGPINDMRTAIKNELTRTERFLFSLALADISGVFIADRQLNNLEIKHYTDLLEQMNCKRVAVYFDDRLLQTTIDDYLLQPLPPPEDKLIGSAGIKAAPFKYKFPDDSIEADDRLLTAEHKKK